MVIGKIVVTTGMQGNKFDIADGSMREGFLKHAKASNVRRG